MSEPRCGGGIMSKKLVLIPGRVRHVGHDCNCVLHFQVIAAATPEHMRVLYGDTPDGCAGQRVIVCRTDDDGQATADTPIPARIRKVHHNRMNETLEISLDASDRGEHMHLFHDGVGRRVVLDPDDESMAAAVWEEQEKSAPSGDHEKAPEGTSSEKHAADLQSQVSWLRIACAEGAETALWWQGRKRELQDECDALRVEVKDLKRQLEAAADERA